MASEKRLYWLLHVSNRWWFLLFLATKVNLNIITNLVARILVHLLALHHVIARGQD